jgi:prophage regulatory protein
MSLNPRPTGQALRPAAAARKLGIGLSTLWKKIRTDPTFPRPIAIASRVTVLMESDLDEYLAVCAAKTRTSRQAARRPFGNTQLCALNPSSPRVSRMWCHLLGASSTAPRRRRSVCEVRR